MQKTCSYGKPSLGKGCAWQFQSEIRAARGERDYFSDDSSDDYNSYYAEVADDAMMGDQDAIDEMRGDFGEGEW